MKNAILANLSDIESIEELSIAFSRPAIKDAFAFLNLNLDELSNKTWEMRNNLADGVQFDANHIAVEFPNFMQDFVRKCAQKSIDQASNEKTARDQERTRFSELANILNGENRDEASLIRSLRLLAQLDTYRGPMGNEKEYTMSQLRDAVMVAATEAEQSIGEFVQTAQVRERLKMALPSMSGAVLDFYSSAISTHASRFKRRSVGSLASSLG